MSEKFASKETSNTVSTIFNFWEKLPNPINVAPDVDDVVIPIDAGDIMQEFTEQEMKSINKANEVISYKQKYPDAPVGATKFGIAYYDDSDLKAIEKAKMNQIALDFNQWLYKNYWKEDKLALRRYILEFYPELLTNQMKYLEKIQELQKHHVRVHLLKDIKTKSDLTYNYLAQNGLITADDIGIDSDMLLKGSKVQAEQQRTNLRNAVFNRKNRFLGGIDSEVVNNSLANKSLALKNKAIVPGAIDKRRAFMYDVSAGVNVNANDITRDADITNTAINRRLIRKNLN